MDDQDLVYLTYFYGLVRALRRIPIGACEHNEEFRFPLRFNCVSERIGR